MRPGVACVLLLAGCYAPGPAPGAPCDPAAPRCPSSQRCELVAGAHVCTGDGPSGSGADAPPAADDRDGDGVVDLLDNCPDAPNASQHDEDLDTRGDACDKCPPFPSIGDPDADGDGVGDACDPNPVAGDRIALFESFASGIPSTWTRAGDWSSIAGTAVHTAVANNLATMVVPLDGTAQQTISAGVTIFGLSGAGGGSLGIVDRFTPAATAGIHCGSGKTATDFFGLIDASNGVVIKSVPYPFGIGSFTIQLRRREALYECTGTDLTSTMRVEESPSLVGLGTKVGLRARTASASYHWFMVVTSP